MPWRRGARFLIVLIIVVGGWWLLQNTPDRLAPSPAGVENLHVVTTTPILYSLAAKVLGDRGTLTNLVPSGASPENYALRPQDAKILERADVLVRVGLDFERFLERPLADAAQRGVTVITASDGIQTLSAEAHGDAEEEEGAHEEEEGASDPHVWTDPLRAITMVENIANGLAQADPAGADEYRARAATVADELRALDAEFRRKLATGRSTKFIAFHPAWGYFAERYGLEQAAVVEKVPGVEPTAQELAELTRTIRASGIRALMSEPQLSAKVIEAIARDLRLNVVEVNPEGGDLAIDGYEKLMRANVDAFARALSAK